jgi:hypothetical protein
MESENNQDAGNQLNESSPLVDSNNDGEDDGPQSSFDNIIPLDKIKHGWMVFGGLVAATASTVQTKAVEAYNSESVQNVKRQTTEAVHMTVAAATPIWEHTKATAISAAEVTKENFHVAAEKAKPTIEKVTNIAQWLILFLHLNGPLNKCCLTVY